MACLGGTPQEPKVWYRYRPDDTFERVAGRICNRTSPRQARTSRSACAGCPAFRGLRWDGRVANGVDSDKVTVYALSESEHRQYQEAVEQMVYDDETWLMQAFYGRMERELLTHPDGRHSIVMGLGERGLRGIGDPDATDRWAAKMREYRVSRPGLDRRKGRDRAAYMRAYRASRKTGSVTRSDPLYEGASGVDFSEDGSSGRGGVGARKGGPYGLR